MPPPLMPPLLMPPPLTLPPLMLPPPDTASTEASFFGAAML
jgi:hypothetical protein